MVWFAGVEAQNQADSYKRMEDGQWFFGLENAWVLTPTRFVCLFKRLVTERKSVSGYNT